MNKMSEDEKQAIEYWKRDIALYHCNTQLASEYYAQIILNLIEKQQKELEQEKEKNKFLKQRNEAISNNMLSLASNSISKDKIRAKIKELEEKSDYWNCDEIEVLKELLEEE